jgi:hypothetical protein
VHAPISDRFYEELEQVFDQFPRYQIEIMLEDFNATFWREDIFKLITDKKSLHEVSNDNGFRIANSVTSKNLIIKSTALAHRDFMNTLGLFPMQSHIIR